MDKFWIYLILINAAACLLMHKDKRNAQQHRFRVPEAVLLSMALLGGSFGAVCGMVLFRHKTRKPIFSVGLPLIFFLQLGLLLFRLT